MTITRAEVSNPAQGADGADRRFVQVRARRQALLREFEGRPFTTQMAYLCGLARSDRLSRDIRSLRRGVYVAAQIPDSHELDCAAALLVAPLGSRMAGGSAAKLFGLPATKSARLCVSIPKGAQLRADAIDIRHHGVASQPITVQTSFGALQASASADFLLEMLDSLTLVEAVELADSILARWPRQVESIRSAWRRSSCSRLGFLKDVVAHAVADVESPMESRLRLLLVLAEFPLPTVQFALYLDGRLRRFDLAYPELKIAIEYDGAHHFMAEERKHHDAIRRDAAAWAGWIVISVRSVRHLPRPGWHARPSCRRVS